MDRSHIVENKKQQNVSEKEDSWILVENIPDSDIFFFQISFRSFVCDKSYDFMNNLQKLMAVYNGFHMDFYMVKKDASAWSESILENFLRKPGLTRDVYENIIKWSGFLKDYGKRLKFLDLHSYTNEQLWNLYKEHYEIHTKLYTYGWYPVQVDILFNNFTNQLKNYLFEVCKDKKEAEYFFVILTTPSEKSILAEEREELFSIYINHQDEIKNYVLNKDIEISKKLSSSIISHREKWGHLGYIYAGNADLFSIEHYLNELVDIERSKESIKEILNKEQRQLEDAKSRQDAFYKEKKTPELYKRLFQAAIDFSLSKLIRRDSQLYTLYQLHHTLLEEMARRLNVSRQHIQFMLSKEVRSALIEGKLDKYLLKKRLESCVYFVNKEEESVFVDEKASEFKSEIKEEIDFDGERLTGQIAQPGYAKGVVKIIIRAQDMYKINEGDILVSIATDPDIVSAMKKAAAIITDQGGITSHAAIVSREMGIPCIIGTKIATQVLKDGDMVEVDADEGVVRILKE